LFRVEKRPLFSAAFEVAGSPEGWEIGPVIREDRLMSKGHWGGAARYGLPGLVAGLAMAWWGGGHGPTAKVLGSPTPGAESNGTIAFTLPVNGMSSQMLYLIDTKSHAFAVYRIEPSNPKGTGSLKLEASRKYEYDLKLEGFNNQPPSVSDIEGMAPTKAK
jgi:hypothetical protein